MNIAELIDHLSRPEAYPEPPGAVEVRQTHISAVFLTQRYAYKVKKPARLAFLDFSTLERRQACCADEVRLNRRLAPDVYLGVVPVVRAGGGLRFEGDGEPVEWAVKMRRLPDEATLESRLERGEVTAATVAALARRVAEFHAAAEAGPHVSASARFEVVAANARDNFASPAGKGGGARSAAVLARLRALTDQRLEALRPLIEARAVRGVPRDTHGDLHLDHVYLFPEREPPGDVVIIDCVEFNERYRHADPVADLAFLAMDLAYHGRRDLARACADAYFRAAGDEEGRVLLPFYSSYRAAVRAKVEGLKAGESEVPEGDRDAARAEARAHWLLALGELETPGRRPCLVLVAGLPGAGKSTLARALAAGHGFEVVRSDEVRKELARGSEGDIYTAQWGDRTYAECLRRAAALVAEGGRVLVDANFRQERRRAEFLGAARRLGAAGLALVCEVEPGVARRRLAGRVGDASDADGAVYERLRNEWESPGPETSALTRRVVADGTPQETLARAAALLREEGLAD